MMKMKTLTGYIKENGSSEQMVLEAESMLPKPKDMADLQKACKKNALFKAIEKQCKALGYTLVDAHFDWYGPNACIPTFRVLQPASEKYAPDIVLDVDMKLNYEFKVTGSSSSRMSLKDAESWAFWAQKGVDLAKWLNKQDLSKLPIFNRSAN
jgi:hypothetical protein